MSGEAAGPGARGFRLVLEYHGRDFEGWQRQAGTREARTVQGVLADAVESVTGRAPRIRGAGRTDAGVHAMGQVASVRVETDLAPEALARALNARLPADVAVCRLDEVAPDWDALREARGKHYRYRLWNGPVRSPLRADRLAWVREPLDVGAMRQAGRAFEGRHDFAALQGAGSDVRTTVRTIERLEIGGRAGAEIVFEVEGEGFLRHMVRNLVGTLIEIGRGRWPSERAAAILASGDRAEAGPTAPAHGLVLVAVRDTWRGAASAASSGAGTAPSAAGDSVDADGPVG